MVPFEGFSDGQGEPSSRAGVYKAQVASAALKGDRTISEVAAHYEIHVNLAAHWKKLLLEGAASVFTKDGKSAPPPDDPEQIGRLQVELAFVKKQSPGLT